MAEVLIQALELTVLGMGMTFISIGALVGGMYLLTFLTRPRAQAESAVDNAERGVVEEAGWRSIPASEDATSTEDDRERSRRAAAATVAVARALAESRGRAPAVTTSGDGGDSAWSSHARSLHLAQRMRYEARKLRGVRREHT